MTTISKVRIAVVALVMVTAGTVLGAAGMGGVTTAAVPAVLGQMWGLDLVSAEPTPEMRLGQASLVVRTEVVGWDKGIVRHEVKRVLYGDFAGRELLVDESFLLGLRSLREKIEKDLGHAATEAEMATGVMRYRGIEKGTEMILYLKLQPSKAGLPQMYCPVTGEHERPPEYLLADRESEIAQMLVTGDYLSPSFPQPADIFMEHAGEADLIVRAKLERFDDNESHWAVTKTIIGKTQKRMVIVPNDVFRLRAEGIVRHSQMVGLPTTQPIDPKQQVSDEMHRLILNELSVGKEAILFLAEPTVEEEAVRAKLKARIYEDYTGKRLDRAEEAIKG